MGLIIRELSIITDGFIFGSGKSAGKWGLMLRFPNPGSTIAHFVAVYNAAYSALNGRVVDPDDMVRAAVAANLATSSGYTGHQAVSRSTRKDRSRDPLYNQMKMYAELFRTMGWLHPTAEGRLNYTFTLLGEQLVAAGRQYWPLLERCVLGIAYPTRVLTVLTEADLRPFAFILRAMKANGGYLSRDEMIIGPLSGSSDRDDAVVAEIYGRIAAARENAAAIDAAMTALSRSRKIKVNTLRNYTRWPIAVLRDSGWVEIGRARFADGRAYRAFFLTEAGRQAADMVGNAVDLRLEDLEALPQEARDAVAVLAHFTMLEAAGFDVEPLQGRIQAARRVAAGAVPALADPGQAIVFSPFQTLAIPDIARAFPAQTAAIRTEKPINLFDDDAPDRQVGRDDRSHLFVAPKWVAGARIAPAQADAVKAELAALLKDAPDLKEVAERFCTNHARDTKDVFYPLVTHLFQILGFPSDYSRAGVNYQRWDACVWVGNHALPVEIKSPTEETVLATKAVRQALENKIVLLSRGGLDTKRELTSLIVGFRVPNERGDMSNLIDNVFVAFGLRLGVIDLGSLAYLAARNIRDGVTIDPGQLAHLRGFFNV